MKTNLFSKCLAFILALATVFSPVAVFARHTHTESGLCSCGGVAINIDNFPAIWTYVMELDTTGDGFLSAEELASVTEMNFLGTHERYTYKGIEFFTNLKSLSCSSGFEELDVSKNTALEYLYCPFGKVASIDLSKNTALKELHCSFGELTELDVSKNTALTVLECYDNRLASLDVSKNTELEILSCYGNNLTKLDLSANTALKKLNCDSNKLASLDLSANTALSPESVFLGNQAPDISLNSSTPTFDIATIDPDFDGTKAITYTEGCSFDGTVITAPLCVSVEYIYNTGKGDMQVLFSTHKTETGLCSCGGVVMNETNFPDANFRAYLSENHLHIDRVRDGFLSFEELEAVEEMYLIDEDISSLKGIEYFTSLTYLRCDDNNLTELDLSKNTKLKEVCCSDNEFTSLDFSGNTELEVLTCQVCPNLTSINLSKNTALKELNCSFNNKLVSLDLSSNKELEFICFGGGDTSQADPSDADAFEDLSWTYSNIRLDLSNNTKLKYLECIYANLTSIDLSKYTDLETVYIANTNLTSLDVSKNTALRQLVCLRNKLTGIDVSKNTALESLNASGNKLADIDVSKNKALKYLIINGCGLTSIDISENTELIRLSCGANNLTSLDVSKNTALEDVDCGYNKLTSLDVSKNVELKYLYCGGNQITALDLSNNTKLTNFSGQQVIYITTESDNNTVDLAEHNSNFDSTKASNVYGGTLNGTKLTCNTYTEYTYDTGADGVEGMEVLFFVTFVDSSEIDDGKVSATIGSEITEKIEELNENDELKQGIDINLPTVNLGFDLKALLNMIFQSMGKDITVFTHMTDIFSLNTAQQNSMYGMGVMSVVSLEVNAGGIKISQFGGDVLVGVPFTLPAGEKAENYEIIYIADNGKKTPMETEYKDGYLWFVTEHFSDYAVVNKNGAGASAKLGDLTGDGKLNSFDYLLVRSYILGLTTFTNAQLSAADVNQDGNINSFDYLLMRAHILGLTTIKGW